MVSRSWRAVANLAWRRRLRFMRVKRISRILGHKHCNCRRDDLFFPKSGLHADSIFGEVRNTTVQVWTVGEGYGIGSEFAQTCCAANNFRDHEVDSVKAILVHRAHCLLSESTRILCTFIFVMFSELKQ